MQIADVRDLGDWIVRSAEAGLAGAFNAVSPPFRQSELLAACAEAAGSAVTFTYVDEEWLVEREVEPWGELPLWVYTQEPGWERFLQADPAKAVAAGLTFRPLEDTARATLAEAQLVAGVGLAPERERELLAEWHGRG